MNRTILTALAAALFASGCTLAPTYERPAAPVAATYPQGDVYDNQPAKGAATRTANDHAAIDIGWREFFIDPRLQRLIELALQNNRDLRVSALKVEEARAQYRIQRADLMPSVSVDGTGTRSRTPKDLSYVGRATVGSDYQVAASASWELDFFGKVRSLTEQSMQTYFSTAQARKAEEILLVSQVADQYLTLVAYGEMLASTKNTYDTARRSYELTKLQYDMGTGLSLIHI